MKRLLTTALLATLALSGQALADNGKGKGKHKAKHDGHPAQYDGKRNGHDNGLHLGHYKRWNRGDRIQAEYLVSRYYVDDYRAYRLDAPPRGYRWVRPYEDDGTYYLVQVATGLISQIFGG